MNRAELEGIAREWMALDPDPRTREATEAMLRGDDEEGLRAHFGSRLQFGTAGIRGALGPGPGRMNRRLVRLVTAGLGRYLLATVERAGERGVVVGYDARHMSREFAADTAAVLASLGLRVWLYDEQVPTPQLAHAVVALGCAAGVMVTASHNPPADNGYKVYWGNGAQIIPPHDRGISAAIDAVDAVGVEEGLDALRRAGRVEVPPAQVLKDYLTAVDRLRVHRVTGARLVYTAMHGVGLRLVEAVLGAAGHVDLHRVVEQVEPDPDFPTVSFPNPEEAGALDLALALAAEVDADAILANDPDADRLAVVVRDRQGGYRKLTGDQIGVLLAEDLLAHGDPSGERMVATTVVSSTLLSRIAAHHGAAYRETLTGFKWIANAALDFPGEFVVGYEEAIGYSIGSVVRDKDGVSAALLFADLVSDCTQRGETVVDRLERIYRRHGIHVSSQRNLVLPGLDGAARIEAMMEGLRAEPPRAIGGVEVVRVVDVLLGRDTDPRTGQVDAVDLPTSNVLAFHLADGSRVVARPSGTEPKIKFYFEVREPLGEDEVLEQVEPRAAARMAKLVDDFVPRS